MGEEDGGGGVGVGVDKGGWTRAAGSGWVVERSLSVAAGRGTGSARKVKRKRDGGWEVKRP